MEIAIMTTIGIIGVIVSALVFTLFLKKVTQNLDKTHKEAILTDSLKFGITLTASGVFGLLIFWAFSK